MLKVSIKVTTDPKQKKKIKKGQQLFFILFILMNAAACWSDTEKYTCIKNQTEHLLLIHLSSSSIQHHMGSLVSTSSDSARGEVQSGVFANSSVMLTENKMKFKIINDVRFCTVGGDWRMQRKSNIHRKMSKHLTEKTRAAGSTTNVNKNTH